MRTTTRPTRYRSSRSSGEGSKSGCSRQFVPDNHVRAPDRVDRSRDSGEFSFTAVVLAGGKSRRFGEPNKAVAVLEGTTFIERVVETVRAAVGDSPIVAVNTDDQRTTIERRLGSNADPAFAFDSDSFGGPLAGLYGSLPIVDEKWVFLTGCDMPRLSAPAIAWLANRLRTTDSTPDALVPVGPNGEREPLHAFYRRDAVADVQGGLWSDASLRVLLDELPETVTVPVQAAPSDASLAASTENVNTKQEYHRMRRMVER